MAIAVLLLAMLASAGDGEAAELGVDLRLTDPVSIKPFEPPMPVVFNFTVEHTGTAMTEWVNIRVLNVSSSWTHRLDANTRRGPLHSTSSLRFLLDEGEVATLTVGLKPDTATPAGTYMPVIRADVVADPDVWDALEVGVVVPRFLSVDLDAVLPPGGEYTVTPPGTVRVAIDLYNTGNGEDRFLLKAWTTMSSRGWTVSITEGADAMGWTPDLSADPNGTEPHRVVVKVYVPGDASPNLLGHVSLEATSYSDPSVSDGSGQVPVRALQVYEFGVAVIGPESLLGQPGSKFEFQFRVTNRGNGQDTFRIYPVFDEDLAPGFDSHASPDTVALEAGENTTFRLVVDAPFGAAKGPYTFAAEVHSSNMALNPILRNVKVQIEQSFALGLTADDPSISANPGDRLTYDLWVLNVGNGLDAVVLELVGSPAQWLTYIQPTTFPLVPGERAHVEVIVYVPDVLDDAARSSYPLTVWANSTRSDAKARLELQVVISPFNRLEWIFGNRTMTSPDEPVAEEGTLRPKPSIDLFNTSTTTFELVLWNMGNTDDNVSIEAEDDDPRMAVHVVPWESPVRPGQELVVSVTIVVDDNILPGEHRFWLNAISQDASVAIRVLPVEFDVVPVFNPRDFADKQYGDPLNDDYTYRYTTDGVDGPVTRSSGKAGSVSVIDIISVTAVLDLETGTVIVTLELKGLATESEGVVYVVHFVNADHQLTGPLVDPRAHHTEGEFTWSSHDVGNSTFWMSLAGGVMGSRVPVTTMEVEVLADKVYFHIGVRDLRHAGVEPGSDIRLYAYCHQVDGRDGEGADGRITYDTAGQGAVSAPAPFSDEPDEGSPGLPVAAGLIIAVVAVVALFMFRRWKAARMAPLDEFDPDGWVEYE